MRNRIIFVLIFGVVLIFRIPVMDLGYGIDPDGWRVVSTSNQIAETGQYVASRLPGYPLQELIYAFLHALGIPLNPLITNGITAVFSALSCILLLMILYVLNVSELQAILSTISFSLVPIVYAESATTMDYHWALFFVLCSFYTVLTKRYLLAGVFLGLAVGARITSGAMLIPLGFLIIQDKKYINLVKFVGVCLLVSLLLFVPVLVQYQTGFLTFFETGYPAMLFIIWRATFGVWGILGLFGLIVSLILIFRNSGIRGIKRHYGNYVYFLILVLVLFGIAFLRLPHESAYLIIIIPFIIIFIAKSGNKIVIYNFCVLTIIGGLLYIPLAINQRSTQLQRLEDILTYDYEADNRVTVILGHLLPSTALYQEINYSDVDIQAQFVYSLNEQEIMDYLAVGETICVAEEVASTVQDYITNQYVSCVI
jgi:hypothetical protein